MENLRLVISAIYLLTVLLLSVNTFNLSPKPNFQFKEPKIGQFKGKYESSYFGYSINLRTNSLMVGAPRTQSDLVTQKENNQTGAIYKCNIKTNSCAPFYMDPLGDINVQVGFTEYTKLKKNNQWLGAVMDGHGSENDSFVVCAPNIITDVPVNNYLFHGVCYESPNTLNARPSFVKALAPLRIQSKQTVQKKFYYMFGQQGFSVHISDNSEEMLIGAPGVLTWKGSVVRYKPKTDVDLGGLSKRYLEKPHSIKRRYSADYDVDILNPTYWKQANDSYFGYAVTSGNFDGNDTKKLLYVSSAPQGNLQSGEVFIYDYVDSGHDSTEKTIKVYAKFKGTQMGEYFGYSLLAEDFNDDELTDLVISAPMHSKKLSNDNGRVYVYHNKGDVQAYFDKPTILMTDNRKSGRFGTSLGKIGDINLDGFKDLAVGAPFEGNGVVYIFLGTANGISSKPSQTIVAAEHSPSPFGGPHMFGMSLSRGVDVDGNKFNDIAIGAPNAEAVYIYRSYPVIQIIASIAPLSPSIGIKDRQFTLRTCLRYSANTDISFNIELRVNITLDTLLGRAVFANSQKREEQKIVVVKENFECVEAPVDLDYNIVDIFKPITLELSYELVMQIPDSSNYCENCVAINPSDRKTVNGKVVFSTGCKSSTCVADLKLRSSIVGSKKSFIIGSARSISLEYIIENSGEPAYLPHIKVTIPSNMNFVKIPSVCKLDGSTLECEVGTGTPLAKGEQASITIAIDSSKLTGKELVVRAEASSSGDELTQNDNVVEDFIPLEEFSEIEIHGKSSSPSVSVEEIGLQMHNITHEIEIRNLGPTNIKQIQIIISIPEVYFKPYSHSQLSLIDFLGLKAKGSYNSRELDIVLVNNDKIITQSPIESIPPTIEHIHGMEYDTSKNGLEYDLDGNNNNNNNQNNNEDNSQTYRRGRFASFKENDQQFNKYTEQMTYHHDISRRSVSIEYDSTYKNLPINRTIQFNCDDASDHLCAKGSVDIYNFVASDTPIKIEISFSIDLSQVATLYTEDKDIFVLVTPVEIVKFGDDEGKSTKVVNFNPYSVITKYTKSTTPIWVYIVSAIVGILLLILMSYGLYRMGFFQRTKKEEMDRLTRQESKIQEDNETEDED